MSHWRFTATDECRRVRREIAKLLTADSDKIPPDRLSFFLGWITPNDPAVPEETWRTIARALETRWAAEKDPEVRHQLSAPITQVLSHIGTKELLVFLRRQLAEGPEQYRAAYALQLFNTLLSEPWSAPNEDEAFTLLERVSDAEEPADRLFAQVGALYRLTDAMVNGRNQAGLAKIEHIEQLPRKERLAKTEEQLQLARQGFADRLKQEMTRHEGRLVQWLAVERMYLDTQTKRNLAEIAGECWEALPALAVARPANAEDEDSPDAVIDASYRLDRALQNRYLSTLMYLATRKEADALPTGCGNSSRRRSLRNRMNAGGSALNFNCCWRSIVRMISRTLTAWLAVDDGDSRWRLALGYLLAELGSVPEAIALFEGVEVADELGPTTYAVLADWYLAANRRDAYEKARIRVFQTLEEWRMYQWLYQKLVPWQLHRRAPPSGFDGGAFLMFWPSSRNVAQPQNYLQYLQQFYQATHDFRLLAVLADSIVGHTAARVYPFVQNLQGVLNEIRDEATADQLKKKIAEVRERAKTAVDRRALDMLETQVERRAAEVQNQAGPHVAAALAALQRAYEHEWSTGEQRLMADFLAGLGRIAPKPLADEQTRQLRRVDDGRRGGRLDTGCTSGCLWHRRSGITGAPRRPSTFCRGPSRNISRPATASSPSRPITPWRLSFPGSTVSGTTPAPRKSSATSCGIRGTRNSGCGSFRTSTTSTRKPCRTTERFRWGKAKRFTKRMNARCSKTSRPPTRTIVTILVNQLCGMYRIANSQENCRSSRRPDELCDEGRSLKSSNGRRAITWRSSTRSRTRCTTLPGARKARLRPHRTHRETEPG